MIYKMPMTILPVLLLIILAGCQSQPLPPKPKLDPWTNSRGGICLDREGTGRLMEYIIKLEAR